MKLSNVSGKWLHASSKIGYDDPEPGFEGYGSSPDDEIELMVMLSGMVSRESAVGGVK